MTITVNYGNDGPDTASDAYVNLLLASGVPVRFDQLTSQQWDDLQNSAVGTDTLGNTPLLFLDPWSCEFIFFQLQGPGPMPPYPLQPLDPGVSGSFTFDLAIPAVAPVFGTLIITDPPSLARMFLPWKSQNQRLYNTSGIGRMGIGVGCEQGGVECDHFDNCFGPRLSYLDPPVTAGLEVVDGGSADPTMGCNPLIGFTPGRIAVVHRDGCPFHDKAHNAQNAGAAGIIIVNVAQRDCGTGIPFNPDCVLDFVSATLPTGINIPAVFLSSNDGEAIIAELDGGGAVSAVMGAVPTDLLELASESWLFGGSDVDPNPDNDDDTLIEMIAIFTDGFESGDTSEWTATVP